MKFGRDVHSTERKGTGGGQGRRQNIKISKNWGGGIWCFFNALRDNITSVLVKKTTFFGNCWEYVPPIPPPGYGLGGGYNLLKCFWVSLKLNSSLIALSMTKLFPCLSTFIELTTS